MKRMICKYCKYNEFEKFEYSSKDDIVYCWRCNIKNLVCSLSKTYNSAPKWCPLNNNLKYNS